LPTIRHVAQLANVSIATASLVANGKSGVSPRLTQRVKAAMEALDYHPDQVARSLKSRRTLTVGMVIPDVTNPFFTDVMGGVEDEARGNGYSVIFCNANEDPVLQQHYLSMLSSRRVDGVLLAPADPHAAEYYLTRRRTPFVFLDRLSAGFSGGAVVTDNLGAAYEATCYLITLGHQRIAIITGRLDLSNGRDRLEGFRKALQEACLPLREDYLQHGDFRLEGGYQSGLRLMQLAEPPTAIFACNNKMTLGLMGALRELRIPCPERVSVLGFDDFDWAANFSPRLTTVAQPTYQMGRQAMEMLVRMMQRAKGELAPGEEHVAVLQNELRVRDSTAPPQP